jgi:hypothetical protein
LWIHATSAHGVAHFRLIRCCPERAAMCEMRSESLSRRGSVGVREATHAGLISAVLQAASYVGQLRTLFLRHISNAITA